jgi:hypothetical protein
VAVVAYDCNGLYNGFRGRIPPRNGVHTVPARSSRGATFGNLFWADDRQIQKSSGSRKRQDAVRLRDQLLGKKVRGELSDPADKVTCGSFLMIFWSMPKSNFKSSTQKISRLVIEANIRPFFGHRKAANVTTAVLKEYRRKGCGEGRSEATCNRELSTCERHSISAGNTRLPSSPAKQADFEVAWLRAGNILGLG